MKLVAIGIGSVIFGIELLRDVFRVPEFRGAELWLVDVHPAALARMTRLAERLNEAAGWDMAMRSTADRREALPGADFVVTAVAVDRIATWKADHDLALRHGFASVLSENGGPGGLSHTLRSVPLMVDIGCDVAELAPNALMPAIRVFDCAHGVSSVGITAGISARLICGLIRLRCRCAGTCPCCSASTTLMSPAMPAADSRWPMLVFADPMSSG